MTEAFYIMGSHDRINWQWVEGPLESYPNMDSWSCDTYKYQYYKVEKVWEFPF